MIGIKHVAIFCVIELLWFLGADAQTVPLRKKGSSDIFEEAKRKSERRKGPDLGDFYLWGKEDFSGNELNRSIWSYFRLGDTVFNSVYAKEFGKVKDGKLFLITDSVAPGLFSSANIATEMNPEWHFKYGYFEIRAKQPRASGNGSAFWMITPSATVVRPVPEPGIYGTEVDIFEYGPINKLKLYYSLHWNGYGPGSFTVTHEDYDPWSGGSPNDFHTYGLLWTPREYIIYVDGIERIRSSQAVSRVPLFIILGSGTGGFAGDPRATKGPWPDSFVVDYLKVYRMRPKVFLNGDCNYKGWLSEGLGPGKYNRKQLMERGFQDNAVSAIEVPDGWIVTAYEHDNFKGRSYVFKKSFQCLPEELNDRISSLVIKAPG